MPDLYQEELQKVLAKRDIEWEARRTELAARRILAAAGWHASGDELRAAAVEDRDIKAEHYYLVVARAIEMQSDETVRGRKVLAVATTSEGSVETENITQAKRDEIREWLGKRRRDFPDLNIKGAHAQALKVFGVAIGFENFRYTYWKKTAPAENGATAPIPKAKATPKKNGAKQPKPAAKASPRPAPVDDRLTAPPRPAPTPNVFRTTILAIEKAPAGSRVILDVEVEHETALELVGCIAAVLGPAQADEVAA